MLICSTHYRQQLNFTDEALEGAAEGVRRLADFRSRLAGTGEAAEPAQAAPADALEFERAFREAMDDDVNAPKAVGALFTFVRGANRQLDAGGWGPSEARAALAVLDGALGVLDLLPAAEGLDSELEAWVEERLAARQAARKARDFAAADTIRDELAARGIEVEDTPQGPRWRKRAE
jgi:cysteinyl-tRNA synthetase